MIDFRSDTVTKPTPEMREAMAAAVLGDDVFGDDPEVNLLEERAAEMLGKEAGLLVPSGTMGNLVCVLTHCRRGDEAILGDRSHIFLNEAGSMAALAGVHPMPLKNRDDGTIRVDAIKAAVRSDNLHHPHTQLLCLENTHNYCAGAVLTPEYMDEAAEAARSSGLVIHLDGARIFNAAAALDIDVSVLARQADSVSFCLSKGLAGPVGSVVCGAGDFIARARRNRKLLGGGMRQAGIIAAPGLVSLEKMTARLAEDHALAARLAEKLATLPGVVLDPGTVQTNIIFFELDHTRLGAARFVALAEDSGVKLLALSPTALRLVTHNDIKSDDIDIALDVFREILGR